MFNLFIINSFLGGFGGRGRLLVIYREDFISKALFSAMEEVGIFLVTP